MPLSGSRSFIYPFVALTPGALKIPSVKFSFFDADSSSYRMVQTPVLDVRVSKDSLIRREFREGKVSSQKRSLSIPLIAGSILISLLIFIFVARLRRQSINLPTEEIPEKQEDVLMLLLTESSDPLFYAGLNNHFWKKLGEHFNLEGSNMNKVELEASMINRHVSQEVIREATDLIEATEAGMFTKADFQTDRKAMVEKAQQIFSKLNLH
jgi:hypothetical protein